jgi:uncharacterized repeat protein (TIGR03803 family)
MRDPVQARDCILGARVVLLMLAVAVATQSVSAQTYTVLHSFTGGADGAAPRAGLVVDTNGNLYGTAAGGGSGAGTVFRVNASRKLKVLYTFAGRPDGAGPYGTLIQDAKGNLYGTTEGGGANGDGAVFKLTKSNKESVLYSFTGGTDGGDPYAGLVMNAAGNLYGTTNLGGAAGYGTAFDLNPTTKVETVLYSFSYFPDGENPYSPLIDTKNHFYGSTYQGGAAGYGTVFELGKKGKETTLYSFTGNPDGANPYAGLISDKDGNLYGTTLGGGASEYGTVFELSSTGVETVLYAFTGNPPDGEYPLSGLVRDAAGNLYGTTEKGGASGFGTVFKLSSTGTEIVLHSFTGADGAFPYATLVRDSKGNLYGTTESGGHDGAGVVFKITP